ncbi:MAG: hypothetical protein NTZ57_05610 [Deltaproteobacteria bacterium]|nr:hypothetical protein [Deltaproteobacteria bacterium]
MTSSCEQDERTICADDTGRGVSNGDQADFCETSYDGSRGWSTIRRGLSTHVRITTTMKRDDKKTIHIRKSFRPETFHKKIYDTLKFYYRS